MYKHILSIVIIAFSFHSMVAQTDAERQQITSRYDAQLKNEVISASMAIFQRNEILVLRYLKENPWVARKSTVNNKVIWLESIDTNGQPVFIATTNFSGGFTIGAHTLYNGGSLGLNIEGQNILAGIWDGGYSRANHREFSGRVEYGETGKTIDNHATHVGGTIIAKGINLALRGMAPQGTLKSYQFDNDISEMSQEAANGMLLSNHSYGRLVTENTSPSVFGKYEETASGFDSVSYANPFYLPVVSAGNDRNKGYNGIDNGYDILTDRTLAKNVVTVGAIEGVFPYQGPESVKMTSFSSWGPTDDGRIKPDLVAKGLGVRSLGSESDEDTATLSGTSMSSPMATGGLMLLHQLYSEQQNQFMRAATIKGLVLMSTKEAGDHPGPDYRFGWGLLDVEAGAKIILALNSKSTIEENILKRNGAYEKAFSTKEIDILTFALSWTDIPGARTGPEEDDPSPVLVNDLDMKVIGPDGTIFFPYKLDLLNPENAATNEVNSVDNIEIIKIDAPAGDYIVKITHKGNLIGNQAYSLLVNGGTPKTASSRNEQIETLSLFPNPANNEFNITFSTGVNGEKVNVQVYNTIGQQVIQKQFDNTGNFNESVDISGLTSGLYLVKIEDGTVSSTRKLIVN